MIVYASFLMARLDDGATAEAISDAQRTLDEFESDELSRPEWLLEREDFHSDG